MPTPLQKLLTVIVTICLHMKPACLNNSVIHLAVPANRFTEVLS